MALEPTVTQLAAVSGAIVDAVGVDIIDAANPAEVAYAAWAAIRDMVLEEAAKLCEREGVTADALTCAALIRGLLKGTP
jgi:hypothetical protein